MDLATALPKELLKRASLRGKEYAWPLADIPNVIKAVQDAGLLNIGGQLQFRLPNGGTCECYWIEVDTYQDVPLELPWSQRIQLTAEAALRQFSRLPEEAALLAEGRKAFGEHLKQVEGAGISLSDLMCFVWYADDEQATA